jgi:hypothetical protein
LKDHEAVVVQLRKDIKTSEEDNDDLGTADFCCNVIEHEVYRLDI